MKKLFVFFAAAMMTASASAQGTAVTANKFGDNWYIGINGGVGTRMKENTKGAKDGFFQSIAPTVGVRVGKNLTTVFGVAAEGDVFFKTNDKLYDGSKTFIETVNVNAFGTFNLMNLFAGYQGQPRTFEMIALGGFGWEHRFNHMRKTNGVLSTVALDLALNFGSDKQYQLYLEPALYYRLASWINGENDKMDMRYNVNDLMFAVKVGFNYKFGCSNGTHNYAIAQLRDQAEIEALMAQINELRNRKPEVIEKEKIVEKIVEKPVQTTREVFVENLVFVTFAQGKSALTVDAKKALDEIQEGKHVQIVGTASPEGSKELNDKLSQARADVVAQYLSARGVLVDEATGKGVQGTTSNRLAIVYVE